MCSSSPPAPAAPDMSSIASANEASAKMAADAANANLDFQKQVYSENKPYSQAMQAYAERVAGQQSDIASFNQRAAEQQWKQNKDQFQPNDAQTVMDAVGSRYLNGADRDSLTGILSGNFQGTEQQRMSEYDRLSQAGSEGAASQAQQQTNAMAASAFAQQSRALRRMGGDPSKLVAAAAEMANSQTANGITAANTAREAQYQRGVGLRTGVANYSRNMPNTAGQAFGLATAAGTAGTGNYNTGAQAGLPGAAAVGDAYGQSIRAGQVGSQAALGYGNLMNGVYGNQISGWSSQNAANTASSAGIGQAIGSFGGAAASYFSRQPSGVGIY